MSKNSLATSLSLAKFSGWTFFLEENIALLASYSSFILAYIYNNVLLYRKLLET